MQLPLEVEELWDNWLPSYGSVVWNLSHLDFSEIRYPS